MPPLNARQRAFKNRKKDANGKFLPRAIAVNGWTDNSNDNNATDLDDSNTFAEAQQPQKTINHALIDNTMITNRPKTYQGHSRTSNWRNKKESQSVDIKQKLTSFGFVPVPQKADEPVLNRNQKEMIGIRQMLDTLQELIKPVENLESEDSEALTYNFVRYSSINFYFRRRLEGVKVGEASCDAARYFWKDNNQSYRAMTIVKWAKEFLREGRLSDHSQGIRNKRKSISNDHVKTMVLE